MDEKESTPGAPSTAVSEKGDTADNEKPPRESVKEISAGDATNVNFDNEPKPNAVKSKTDPEMRNHVGHKTSVDKPSSTAKDIDHDINVDEASSSAKEVDSTYISDQTGYKKIGKFLS